MERLNSYMLPIAMVAGIVFHGFFAGLVSVTPYLIFVMLLISFSRLEPRDLRLGGLPLTIIAAQIALSLAVFFSLKNWDLLTAEGLMVCCLTPTATSAVIIASMLGARLETMAAATLAGNIATAILAPVVFSLLGRDAGITFASSFLAILSRMVPVLILPFLVAVLLRYVSQPVHSFLCRIQKVSFYIWGFALAIVTGKTYALITGEMEDGLGFVLRAGGLTLVLCLLQFVIGRLIGVRFGDKVAGGQSLGQKNTILAIWMAQMWLNPVCSVAPAAYVLWQNGVNSVQLWLKGRKERIK